MVTHPDTVLMPVLFPDPARVAVEQQVTADPVPAVIPSLCGHSRHLHLLLEVHLEPGLLVSHHGRPTSCSWGIAEKYGQRVSIKHRYCRSAVDCCGFYARLHLGFECTNVESPNVYTGSVRRVQGEVTLQLPQLGPRFMEDSWLVLKYAMPGLGVYTEQNPASSTS